jgi:hypothetical protein
MQQAYHRIAAVLQEEPAILKKRKRSGMDDLVGDIISTAGGSGSAVRSSNLKSFMTKSDMDIDAQPNEAERDTEPIRETGRRPDPKSLDRPGPQRKASVLHTSRSSAFAGPSKLSREAKMEPSPASMPNTLSASGQEPPHWISNPAPIFAGKKFVVAAHAEDAGQFPVAIALHGAQVITEDAWKQGAKIDYLVVRL